jgi:DNA polymerase V
VKVVSVTPLKASRRRLVLPLAESSVRAGFPSPADDYADQPLDLGGHLIRNKAATFIVRAKGDSMQGAGIQDGALLVVDRSAEAKDGSIVVAVVDGALTVKRLTAVAVS